jgi:hypothetical protein
MIIFMANNKTTTKAKTKTSAAKTTKKTKSVKVTKKVSKKIVKKVSVKPSSRLRSVMLKEINLASIISSLVLITLAYLFMAKANTEITVSYLTADKLNSDTLAPAYRHLMDIGLRCLLIVTLALAVIKPLLDLTRNKAKYAAAIKEKLMHWRWLDHAIQYAIFAAVAGLLAGYQDLTTIELLAFMGLSAGFFTWLAEKFSAKDKVSAGHFNIAAMISAAVLFLFLAQPLVLTYMLGKAVADWYIVLPTVLLAIYMTLNIVNQRKHLNGAIKFTDYKKVERNYLLIGIVARIVLAAILIIGLVK